MKLVLVESVREAFPAGVEVLFRFNHRTQRGRVVLVMAGRATDLHPYVYVRLPQYSNPIGMPYEHVTRISS